MQCFTMLRTLGASARHHVKHIVHHFGAHPVHRAHHVIAHPVIRPVPFPAMVCIVSGLTAAGVGGLVAKGMGFAPVASKDGTNLASTLAPNVAGETGSPWASLSSSHPTEIGGLPVPPSSLDWGELGSPPATGLVVLAILIRRNKAVCGRIVLRQQLRQIGQCRDCVIGSVAEFFGASAHHAKHRGQSVSAPAADPGDLETEGLCAGCVEAV